MKSKIVFIWCYFLVLIFYYRCFINMFIYDKIFRDGVSFNVMGNRNFGLIYGIYIVNGLKDMVRNFCFVGSLWISNIMNIDEFRIFGIFDCL